MLRKNEVKKIEEEINRQTPDGENEVRRRVYIQGMTLAYLFFCLLYCRRPAYLSGSVCIVLCNFYSCESKNGRL